jgi:hypothetical protein
MPRSYSRRPPRAQPQTAQCRYADGAQRCRSIATVDGFCVPHLRAIEQGITQRSPLEDLIDGLFGVRRVSRQRMAEAGVQVVHEQLRTRFPGVFAPGAVPGEAPAGAPPRGRPRVSPEAIERRKKILAARGVMGFPPDDPPGMPLTEDAIRKKRQQLARLYHDDGRSKDDVRADMMRKVNEAAEILIAAAKRTRPG